MGIEHKKNAKSFLSSVLNEISLIGSIDPKISNIRDKINKLNEQIKEIEDKVLRKEELLKRAEETKEQYKNQITILDDENFRIKLELLDSLGSEL